MSKEVSPNRFLKKNKYILKRDSLMFTKQNNYTFIGVVISPLELFVKYVSFVSLLNINVDVCSQIQLILALYTMK